MGVVRSRTIRSYSKTLILEADIYWIDEDQEVSNNVVEKISVVNQKGQNGSQRRNRKGQQNDTLKGEIKKIRVVISFDIVVKPEHIQNGP